MAKSIDITAKISNIQQVRDQLAKLNVNVTLKSPQLDQLLNLAKSGLNIKAEIKPGPQLQKLLQLAAQGLSIPTQTRSGVSGGGGGGQSSLQRFMEQEQIRLENAFANSQRRIQQQEARRQQNASNFAGSQRSQALQAGKNIGYQRNIANQKKQEALQAGQVFRTNQQAQVFKQRQAQQEQAYNNKLYQTNQKAAQARQDDAEEAALQAGKNIVYQRNLAKQSQADALQAGKVFRTNQQAQVFKQRQATQEQTYNNQLFKTNQNAAKARQTEAARVSKETRTIGSLNQTLEGGTIEQLLGNFDSFKKEQAEKAGIDPADPRLRSRAQFFNPKRLANRETATALAFSGLFGGVGGAVGGAIGGAVLGGPAGVTVGVGITEAFARTFDKVKEVLTSASEAGLEFERSVAGISGALGATTKVIRPNGQEAGDLESLSFNRKRATELQFAAREALLPLGFGGETEAALTQSFVQSRSAQGQVPSASTTKTILGRLGAFIQLAAPDLATNPTRTLKDTADIFNGSSNAKNTRLGSALAPVAPQLFTGKQLSDKDLLEATAALDKYIDSLKNSGTALDQFNRIQGALATNSLNLGESFNSALVPGLREFADQLADPTIKQNLMDLGKGFGQAASAALTFAGNLSKNLLGNTPEAKTAKSEGLIFGRENSGNVKSILDANPQLAARFAFDPSFRAGVEKGSKEAKDKAAGIKPEDTSESSLGTKLGNLFNQSGIGAKGSEGLGSLTDLTEIKSANNPFAQLGLANSELLNKAIGLSDTDASKEKIGDTAQLKLGQAQLRLNATRNLGNLIPSSFDTGTASGRIQADKFRQSNAGEEANALKEVIGLRQKELQALQGVDGQEGKRIAITAEIQKAEIELAAARVKGAGAARDLIKDRKTAFEQQAGISRLNEFFLPSAIKKTQIQLASNADERKNILNDSTLSPEERKERLNQNEEQRSELNVKLIGTQQEQISVFQQLRNASEGLSDTIFKEGQNRRELNRSLSESQRALAEFSTNLEASATQKEGGLIATAKQLIDLNGTSGDAELDTIAKSPELTKQYQIKQLSAGLSQQEVEVGRSAVTDQSSGAGDLFSRKPGFFGSGSFQLGEANNQARLQDAAANTSRDLTELGRAVRDATENLTRLNATVGTKLQEQPADGGAPTPLPNVPIGPDGTPLGGLKGGFQIENFPKFASGGRPQLGKPAIVGEAGPELFLPDVSGTIYPNGTNKSKLPGESNAHNAARIKQGTDLISGLLDTDINAGEKRTIENRGKANERQYADKPLSKQDLQEATYNSFFQALQAHFN